MGYFDLLKQDRYFNRFLQYYNGEYARKGVAREKNYASLIGRYRSANNFAALISNTKHLSEIYAALGEFGYNKRGSETVPDSALSNSIISHNAVILRLANNRMDSFGSSMVPQVVFDDLKLLYDELEVVPSGKPKLVYVSKTLHFLLPDLVMPVDNWYVLRFLKSELPRGKKEFDLFEEVFKKYVELAHHIELNQDNGDGDWWNWSVPKRIDNAITGFWKIFNDDNMQHVICGNIDILLDYLKVH